MSKAEEFDALANAATPGDWECRDGEDIVAEVDHEDTLTIECVSSFAYKQDARGMTVRVNPMDYDGDDDDTAEGWAKSDREFIMWCANNRDIITRALRIVDVAENPSQELLEILGKAFTRTPTRYIGGMDAYDEERVMLKALVDSVK